MRRFIFAKCPALSPSFSSSSMASSLSLSVSLAPPPRPLIHVHLQLVSRTHRIHVRALHLSTRLHHVSDDKRRNRNSDDDDSSRGKNNKENEESNNNDNSDVESSDTNNNEEKTASDKRAENFIYSRDLVRRVSQGHALCFSHNSNALSRTTAFITHSLFLETSVFSSFSLHDSSLSSKQRTALIKCQWWKDAVEAILQQAKNQAIGTSSPFIEPVVTPSSSSSSSSPLDRSSLPSPFYSLSSVLDAVIDDISSSHIPPSSIDALSEYGRLTMTQCLLAPLMVQFYQRQHRQLLRGLSEVEYEEEDDGSNGYDGVAEEVEDYYLNYEYDYPPFDHPILASLHSLVSIYPTLFTVPAPSILPPSLYSSLHTLCSLLASIHGICLTLRSLPRHCSQGKLFLPSSLMESRGVRASDFKAGGGSEKVNAVVKEVVNEALGRLRIAREMRREIEKKVNRLGFGKVTWEALLPTVLYERELKRFVKCNYEPFHAIIQQEERAGWEPLLLRAGIWRRKMTKTF